MTEPSPQRPSRCRRYLRRRWRRGWCAMRSFVRAPRCSSIRVRREASRSKTSLTSISPGVAENPEQHVHIRIPHGLNIGGTRQPPRCVNSQHSHETAEVFIVHSGRRRFKTGHDGMGATIDLKRAIPFPIHGAKRLEYRRIICSRQCMDARSRPQHRHISVSRPQRRLFERQKTFNPHFER